MAVTDAGGTVLSVSIHSASPHEVKLVEDVLKQRFINELPVNLIGDRAYDSDPLDEELRRQGIGMISPHRGKRKRPRMAGNLSAISVGGKRKNSSPGSLIIEGV